MGTTGNQVNPIFQESRRSASAIDQYGMTRREWWLNVNYAEIIEIRDAVAINSLKARAAN